MSDDATVHPLPSLEGIAAIVELLNVIESPDFVYGKSEGGKDESGAVKVPYYVMSDDAKRFVQALPRHGFILKFNWGEWQDEARQYVENPEMLNEADLEVICKLFTTHVRKDRFCDGHLKAMFDNGHVVGLLKQLKELLDLESHGS